LTLWHRILLSATSGASERPALLIAKLPRNIWNAGILARSSSSPRFECHSTTGRRAACAPTRQSQCAAAGCHRSQSCAETTGSGRCQADTTPEPQAGCTIRARRRRTPPPATSGPPPASVRRRSTSSCRVRAARLILSTGSLSLDCRPGTHRTSSINSRSEHSSGAVSCAARTAVSAAAKSGHHFLSYDRVALLKGDYCQVISLTARTTLRVSGSMACAALKLHQLELMA
jgi:hypothetical protein